MPDVERLAKRCYGCELTKPLGDFAWRRQEKNQRDNMSRARRSAYGKAHYAANRQRYIDQAAARTRIRRAERTTRLIHYLTERGCTDCSERDPVVLEFDHLRDKAFDTGGKLVDRSWEAILAEIEKCEVVCANCHRRRTARRRRSLRFLATSDKRATGLEPAL